MRSVVATNFFRVAWVSLVATALVMCCDASRVVAHGGGGGGGGGGHGGGGGFGGGYGMSGYSGHYSGSSMGMHSFSGSSGIGASAAGRSGYAGHSASGSHPGPHPGPHPWPHPWYGGWGWGWGWGDWWPWYEFAWWPTYYCNCCYGVPYAGDAYLAYADAADNAAPYVAYKPTDDGTMPAPDAEPTPDAEPIPAGTSMGPLVAGPSTSSVEGYGGNDDPFDFHSRARAEFSQGDYRKATYFAAHATVDEPRNPHVHLLYSLGLFALGEYRGAAVESHAVMSLGKLPDWNTVYAFYGNVEPYTNQLRALEKYAHLRPQSPEARFLLGFHYMMIGHANEAKVELLAALKLAPRDRLAAKLLTEAGGKVPPEIAKQLAELPPIELLKPTLPKPPDPQPPPKK